MTGYATKSHTYRDYTIYPCEWARGQHHPDRWVVQTYHKTGAPYADESCPHAATLREARDLIDDMIYYATKEARA